MIAYSKELYLIPFSGTMVLPMNDFEHGYLYIDRDLYVDILRKTEAGFAKDIGKVFTDKSRDEVIDKFKNELPQELHNCALLLKLLDFDPPTEVEEKVGSVSVMLRNMNFTRMLELGENLKMLRFTPHILKEYQVAWTQFFANCVPSEALKNPDSIHNKYMFLTLAPFLGQVNSYPVMGGVPAVGGFGPAPMAPPQANNIPDNPEDITWEICVMFPKRFMWFGNAAFMDSETSNYFDFADVMPQSEIDKLAKKDEKETAERVERDMEVLEAKVAEISGNDSEDGAVHKTSGTEMITGEMPKEELRGIRKLLDEGYIKEGVQ